MNKSIAQFKEWYELRPQREQILLIFAMLAAIYAILNVILLSPLESKKVSLLNDIKATDEKMTGWKTQLTALRKIPDTPLYKEWVAQHNSLQKMQTQYKYLLQTSATQQWQDIIRNMLLSQPNITLVEIQNSPESVYNPASSATSEQKIYQQKLEFTVISDYFGLINYLKKLETELPYIHWISLSYDVTSYPMATIKMEFSIIYEKNA